jgi:hypothetical protein
MAALGTITLSKRNSKPAPVTLTGSSTVDSAILDLTTMASPDGRALVQLVGDGAWAWADTNLAYASLEPVLANQPLTLSIEAGGTKTIYLGASSGTPKVHAKTL